MTNQPTVSPEEAVLGYTVIDKVTGFRGVVTGVTKYLAHCVQLLVQPPVNPSEPHKQPDSFWIDVDKVIFDMDIPRVVLRAINPPAAPAASSGGEKEAPRR